MTVSTLRWAYSMLLVKAAKYSTCSDAESESNIGEVATLIVVIQINYTNLKIVLKYKGFIQTLPIKLQSLQHTCTEKRGLNSTTTVKRLRKTINLMPRCITITALVLHWAPAFTEITTTTTTPEMKANNQLNLTKARTLTQPTSGSTHRQTVKCTTSTPFSPATTSS